MPLPVLQVGLGGGEEGVGGSGGHRDRASFEEDLRVDESIGEGVEVGCGVDISLIGDVSSVVLEARERAFSDGARFVYVVEVCGGTVECESVVVIKIDDTGASVGFSVSERTG